MRRALLLVPGLALVLSGTGWSQQESSRLWSSGIGLRVHGAPGEIGRQPNATGGHEDLIARLGAGLALAIQAGLENRWAGAELRISWSGRSVEVNNPAGVEFPNHGEPPLTWTANLVGYPLAPFQRRAGIVQPFVTLGGGGLLIQVDLDNINGKTLYHSFHWNVGGGIRIMNGWPATPFRTVTFVELRVDRTRVGANRPLGEFDWYGGSVSLGMRW